MLHGRRFEALTAILDTAASPEKMTVALETIIMASYITLANFTEQGARAIKNSPERFEAFKSLAESAGVSVKSVHWTLGAYDLVLVVEGNEEAVATLNMKIAALGNVRTQTLRGFTATEMRKLVSGLS